jgi:hypothetical protein
VGRATFIKNVDKRSPEGKEYGFWEEAEAMRGGETRVSSTGVTHKGRDGLEPSEVKRHGAHKLFFLADRFLM